MPHDPDHKFDPKCPGCRPAIIDPVTSRCLPDSHPARVAANDVFDSLPFERQEALNRVWVHNSRAPEDLAVVQEFQVRFQARTTN